MVKGTRGTGHKGHGGGKSRTNKDHRMDSKLITKHRWDDIVAEQLLPENAEKATAEATELDPDKPGLGQFYCLSCAKYFISARALADHSKTPKHKRRLKMLKTTKPYSHEEARAAAGCGPSDHGYDRREPPARMEI
uniref:C2H2-type domain-containing protein n=1 Tax=Haptolina ericina TaxID=156174 RepID=A0A7S3AYE6_9EUKA